jgi:hypothetical protein
VRARSDCGLVEAPTGAFDLPGRADVDRRCRRGRRTGRRSAGQGGRGRSSATRWRQGRIPRQKATAALTALLETGCAGGLHADCVTAVDVFGSYARGALTVGDVDTDIE